MSATKTRRSHETRAGEGARTEPPWNVVLHNDWDNSMPKVVLVLVRVVPGMTVKKAAALMWQAHSRGQATVKRCHKELAELYRERLREAGLTVSIEPSD
jgi:ATP-dependent Clp protease adaptor protein ClpS